MSQKSSIFFRRSDRFEFCRDHCRLLHPLTTSSTKPNFSKYSSYNQFVLHFQATHTDGLQRVNLSAVLFNNSLSWNFRLVGCERTYKREIYLTCFGLPLLFFCFILPIHHMYHTWYVLWDAVSCVSHEVSDRPSLPNVTKFFAQQAYSQQLSASLW